MPEAATEHRTPTVVSLPPDALDRHPLNPRPPLSKDERLAELVDSIRVHGQKQPCVVIGHLDGARGTRYRIVIGHRRAAACKEVGRDVLCIIEDLDDDAAVAIMLSDNEVHADVDPFLEAKAVGTLLARPNWTLQSVAEALGKSDRWVARRANLSNLRPDVRKTLAPLGWPLEWTEELAKLDAAAQDALAPEELRQVASRDDLDQLLAERLQLLGKAPWSLEDEGLVPKAGSCAACPKTSLRAPGLFDAGEDVENPKKALRAAVCRDATCWAGKRAAWYERLAAEAAAGGAKVVKFSHYGAIKNPPAFTKDLPLAASYDVDAAGAVKKDAPGAVLAIELNYEGEVTGHRWVKDPGTKPGTRKGAAGAPAKGKEPSAAARLEASKERIAKRRAAWVDQAFKDAITDASCPGPAIVFAFATAFEVPRAVDAMGYSPKQAKEKFAAFLSAGADLVAEELWTRLPRSLETWREPWMATHLGIDLKAIEAQARKEIPDPKSWKSLELQAKGGKKAPRKGGPGKPPKWWTGQQAKRNAARARKKRGKKTPPVADTLDEHGAAAGQA